MGEKVAFVGVGRMGEALLAGLLKSGRSADDVVIVQRTAERANELTLRYGTKAQSARDAAEWADVIVLGVKPDKILAVCDDIRDSVDPSTLIVSVAAGVSTHELQMRLPEGVAVVRAMPNTPAFVGEGMTAISAGSLANEGHLDRAEALLATVGKVVRVDERKQDAVVAVSGSGPAYFFFLVEAMTDAGVQLGLTRDLARELAVQTAVGSAALMRDTGEHPTVLRENVMSPGGTTAAAIRELEEHGVRGAVYAALDAARTRSAELSG